MISETETEDIAVANYQDGFLDGMEKGMEKKAKDAARNLKALDVDPSIIAQATGLSEEQVKAL